jgi:hypothetical protein
MGTIATPADLLKRFQTVATGVPAASLVGAVAAGDIVRAAVALSSGKYVGRPIVATAVARYPNGIGTFKGPAVQVKMTNRRAHLLDHDNKLHGISPGALTGRRTQSPVLSNQVTGFFSAVPVKHPGTKGKFMWEKGLVVAEPKVVDLMNKAIGDQLLKVFR